MPATVEDPATIEEEIEEKESRRDRLREKRDEVDSDLREARAALQRAEDEEGQDEALDRAERLQVQHDTLTEAVKDVEAEIEALRDELTEAEAAQRREEKIQALAEKGRTAIQAREEYEAVRDEVLDLLREKAPELARLYSEWSDAAQDFRRALVREETHVQRRRSSTTEEDVERAEALIGELKDREVQPFKNALAPHHAGRAEFWLGWSHDNGYTGPGGDLGQAVESIRAFGNQSIETDE